jgi:hypothetical protein
LLTTKKQLQVPAVLRKMVEEARSTPQHVLVLFFKLQSQVTSHSRLGSHSYANLGSHLVLRLEVFITWTVSLIETWHMLCSRDYVWWHFGTKAEVNDSFWALVTKQSTIGIRPVSSW